MLILGLALSCEAAAQSTFRITQVFSTIDGAIQFVELTEMAGMNGQHRFAGLTLTSTHAGLTKQYTFRNDLASDQTAHAMIVVATSRLPVEARGGYNCCYDPDYLIPPRFIPTDAGTIDFADVDRVSYSALPVDGLRSLDSIGGTRAATVPRGTRCLLGVECSTDRYYISGTYPAAIEYYNADMGRFFLSASAPDIDALDTGRIPGWQRTGASFIVAAVAGGYPGLTQPVCRIYFASTNTHFYSASSDECEQVARTAPGAILESDAAFYVAMPDAQTGACPRDTDINGADFLIPLYRLWDRRGGSQHRYTTDAALRDSLVGNGYVAEGYGAQAVAMCVP